jgi:hypothetical protein
MYVVQISLLIITFLSLISQILSLSPKKSTHTLALRHVSICGVSFLILILILILLMPLVE